MNAPGPFTDMTAPVAVHELGDNPDNIQLEEKMYWLHKHGIHSLNIKLAIYWGWAYDI